MFTRRPIHAVLTATAIGGFAAATLTAGPAAAAPPDEPGTTEVRVATYNLSLNRNAQGQLVTDLSTGTNAQAKTVAEVIQRANPDIVLLNEFDYVEGDVAVDLFRDELPRGGAGRRRPGRVPLRVRRTVEHRRPERLRPEQQRRRSPGAPVGDDAFGFGVFAGQFGMAVLSKYPIDDRRGAHLPALPLEGHAGRAAARRPEHGRARRLVLTRGARRVPPVEQVPLGRAGARSAAGRVHVLASHPTPPTFDGPEDRNGTRNHDEIRFWADYVTPGRASRYIYDDEGAHVAGCKPGDSFVILGDQNADPLDGDSVAAAIDQLLDHPRITDPLPTSDGAVEAAALQGGANLTHRGDPAYDTADFNDNPAPGNLRADYVLPSRDLRRARCRRVLAGAGRPAVGRSPGPSRSRAATTGWSGSTCGCTADPDPPSALAASAQLTGSRQHSRRRDGAHHTLDTEPPSGAGLVAPDHRAPARVGSRSGRIEHRTTAPNGAPSDPAVALERHLIDRRPAGLPGLSLAWRPIRRGHRADQRGPQGFVARIPGSDAGYRLLTRVSPLGRGVVVERAGTVFVR